MNGKREANSEALVSIEDYASTGFAKEEQRDLDRFDYQPTHTISVPGSKMCSTNRFQSRHRFPKSIPYS